MDGVNIDDWVCFTDRDTWFPHAKYGKIIDQYTKQNEFGLLTCQTNRVGTMYQCFEKKYWDVESSKRHVEIAEGLFLKHNTDIQDITLKAPMSGMLILISKRTWLSCDGFKKTGLLGVDNSIHYAVRNKGGKVGMMLGVYVWHYYRNGNQKDRKHLCQ